LACSLGCGGVRATIVLESSVTLLYSIWFLFLLFFFFFFQAEDGIRDWSVTGVQTCALPISTPAPGHRWRGAGVVDRRGLRPAHEIGRGAGRGRGENAGGAVVLKKKKRRSSRAEGDDGEETERECRGEREKVRE